MSDRDLEPVGPVQSQHANEQLSPIPRGRVDENQLARLTATTNDYARTRKQRKRFKIRAAASSDEAPPPAASRSLTHFSLCPLEGGGMEPAPPVTHGPIITANNTRTPGASASETGNLLDIRNLLAGSAIIQKDTTIINVKEKHGRSVQI